MAQWGDTDAFADVPAYLQPKIVFNGTTAITANDISVPAHSFENGDAVVYKSTAPATGLTDGTTYFIVARTADTVQLSATFGGAAITPVGGGAATDSLQKVADGYIDDASFVHDADSVVFIDTAEASVTSNIAKGLSTPGWHKFSQYDAESGETRHRSEVLVSLKSTSAAAGDQDDDAVAADAALTIDTQPVSNTVSIGANPHVDVFTVVATTNVTGATITYKWQTDPAGGTTFVDADDGAVFSGTTTDKLGILDVTGLDADTFQCVVTATLSNGEVLTVTSTSVALTVTA
jgi:hypothetical protein